MTSAAESPTAILESIEHLLMLIVRERIGTQTWLYDDALQEARIRAWQRLEEGHPKGIAVHAAKQAVIDVLRGHRMTGSKAHGKVITRATSIHKENSDGEYILEPADTNAEVVFEQIELRETLRGPLAALPERDRAVVTATYFEGRTRQEIADQLGVSHQAVSQRLRKALASMRTTLAAA